MTCQKEWASQPVVRMLYATNCCTCIKAVWPPALPCQGSGKTFWLYAWECTAFSLHQLHQLHSVCINDTQHQQEELSLHCLVNTPMSSYMWGYKTSIRKGPHIKMIVSVPILHTRVQTRHYLSCWSLRADLIDAPPQAFTHIHLEHRCTWRLGICSQVKQSFSDPHHCCLQLSQLLSCTTFRVSLL